MKAVLRSVLSAQSHGCLASHKNLTMEKLVSMFPAYDRDSIKVNKHLKETENHDDNDNS